MCGRGLWGSQCSHLFAHMRQSPWWPHPPWPFSPQVFTWAMITLKVVPLLKWHTVNQDALVRSHSFYNATWPAWKSSFLRVLTVCETRFTPKFPLENFHRRNSCQFFIYFLQFLSVPLVWSLLCMPKYVSIEVCFILSLYVAYFSWAGTSLSSQGPSSPKSLLFLWQPWLAIGLFYIKLNFSPRSHWNLILFLNIWLLFCVYCLDLFKTN